jgi:hypothetical protein
MTWERAERCGGLGTVVAGPAGYAVASAELRVARAVLGASLRALLELPQLWPPRVRLHRRGSEQPIHPVRLIPLPSRLGVQRRPLGWTVNTGAWWSSTCQQARWRGEYTCYWCAHATAAPHTPHRRRTVLRGGPLPPAVDSGLVGQVGHAALHAHRGVWPRRIYMQPVRRRQPSSAWHTVLLRGTHRSSAALERQWGQGVRERRMVDAVVGCCDGCAKRSDGGHGLISGGGGGVGCSYTEASQSNELKAPGGTGDGGVWAAPDAQPRELCCDGAATTQPTNATETLARHRRTPAPIVSGPPSTVLR